VPLLPRGLGPERSVRGGSTHPLPQRAWLGTAQLALRNLPTPVEISVDKNSTVVFPAPLMSTIHELGAFLNRESSAVASLPATAPAVAAATTNGEHAAA